MITGLGAVFLPLYLLFINNPARQLELVFIGSAFAAAAVLVVGGFGVAPGLLPAALFVGFVTLKLVFGTRYPAERLVLKVYLPFILVAGWALISSILMPRFFASEILVWPQKAASFIVLSPLQPNSGNYTQDAYFMAAAALTVMAGIYLTRQDFNLGRLLDVYFASGLMVVFISLWQFVSNTIGIWFPTNFFLSNPGWALLTEESVGSFIRITGPFSEPSALASYLCGTVGGAGWVILNGHGGLLAKITLAAAGFVVLLSTSTTGYVALALMAGMLVVYTVALGSAGLRKRVVIGFAAIAVFTVACVITVPVIAPGVAKTVATITDSTFNKQSSSSYNDRTGTDKDSVHEAWQSYGLGVGWGSNRSSSLIPGLLAGVGVVGVAGLLWFAIAITLHVRTAHRLATSAAQARIMHGCVGAILGMLSAAVLSDPTITSPDFFLLIALLIATAARVRYEAAR
jgi:hypothetical protein